MVDSASGELKTCFGNSVESFCVNLKTPPFGSSMSSPKMTRRESSSSPSRRVLFTVSPIRYLPGGRISLSIFGSAPLTFASSSFGDGSSAFSASVYSLRMRSLISLSIFTNSSAVSAPSAINFSCQHLTGAPFHCNPPKMWTAARSHFLERICRGIINLLNVLAGQLPPFIRLENPERQRIYFPGRTADPVAVVFDNEQHRQFPFFCKTNCFEEIALTSGGIAHGRHNDIFFAVQLD